MKIDTSDLKKEYTSYCARRTDESRKYCLSPEKLMLLARRELSDKEKEDSLRHIIDCIYCSREMKEILKILHYEKQFVDDLTKSRKKTKKIFPGWNWKTAAAAAVLFFLIVSSYFLVTRIKHSINFRGSSSHFLNLIEPVDTYTSKPLPVFKWTEVKKAEYYVLEIYDEFLFPLWESSKLYNPRLQLPEEVVYSLSSNTGYYWMVTAHLDNGKTIESSLEKFVFHRIFR